jgi:hypothetical protein
MLLSARSGEPILQLLQKSGQPSLVMTLDPAGRPSIKFDNPDPAAPTAALEIDDKGAHVKFDRPGDASSYLFLNNRGGSGIVILDSKGVRRLNILAAPDGSTIIERFGSDGKLLGAAE